MWNRQQNASYPPEGPSIDAIIDGEHSTIQKLYDEITSGVVSVEDVFIDENLTRLHQTLERYK